MKDISLIIPAYKPDKNLLTVLADAKAAGFTDILVIDDGSGAKFDELFGKVQASDCCTLLRHETNKGKGAALQTAFKFFLENREDKLGVVTADADGQHLTKDIVRVAQKLKESNQMVLGCRNFSDSSVPFRSKFGNLCTIGVFKTFFGMRISDTQTGLRAFPKALLPELLTVKGDRYEYETNMLFYVSRKSLPIAEVVIDTVYLDENSSSHFRVIRDSVRVYGLIIKYLCSSFGATVIDNLVFFLLKQFPIIAIAAVPQTFIAAVLARVVSSFVNYLVNAKVVFGGAATKKTLAKYFALAVVQIAVSSAIVFLVEKLLFVDLAAVSTLIKILVDTALFFISFRIQHKWVFNNK